MNLNKCTQKSSFLVIGGSRSGKSDFARLRCEKLGLKRLFIATAISTDSEMEARIGRHRNERNGRWTTVEEPCLVVPEIEKMALKQEVVLLDCVSTWITNLILDNYSDNKIEQMARELADLLALLPCHLGVVASETGMGLIPDSPLGRRFRDLNGLANQILAQKSCEVFFCTAGIARQIK